MYGSDQFASTSPMDLLKMNKLIRILEIAQGDGKKYIREEEKAAREKLTKPYWVTRK